MIIGGGAALYGGFRSLGSYDYGYGSIAARGLGAAVIGALITTGRLRCLYRVHGSSQQAGGRTLLTMARRQALCLQGSLAHHTARLYPNFAAPNGARTRLQPAGLALTASRPCQPDYGQAGCPAPDYGQVPGYLQYGQFRPWSHSRVPGRCLQNAGDESATPSEAHGSRRRKCPETLARSVNR